MIILALKYTNLLLFSTFHFPDRVGPYLSFSKSVYELSILCWKFQLITTWKLMSTPLDFHGQILKKLKTE